MGWSLEYQFKPPGKTCAATGEALTPGSVCHSVLVEQAGRLTRVDYSQAGWSGPPPHAIATWKTIIPLPPNPDSIRLDPERLFQFFELSCEEGSPSEDSLRYVAAVVLLQARRLKLEGARGKGEDEVLDLTAARGDGVYEIRNLRLNAEDMHAIQRELKTRLMTGGAE